MEQKSPKITVLCVDDNVDICQMMATAINSQTDMQCIGMLHNACALVDEVTRLQPQIVLLDLTMPGEPPLSMLMRLRDADSDARVIVFSGYDDQDTVSRAIDAGAWGFVSKHADLQKIYSTIRQVAVGEFAYSKQ